MAEFQSRQRHGEQGMALIMAIGFMAILSTLGAFVLQTATRDVGASGSKSLEKQVFYAADRTVEYSMTRGLLLNMPTDGQVDLMNDHVEDDPTKKQHHQVIASTDSKLNSGKVYDLGPNDMPANLAELFGEDFGANYYHVEAKAETLKTGAGGAPLAKSNVNASIVRLFKRDDDTIFRTTRGG